MNLLLKLAIAAVALTFAVLAYNTTHLPAPPTVAAQAPLLKVDEAASAQRLAGAVRIPTISFEDRASIDARQLEAFADYLQRNFPRVHAALTRERVSGGSLLYTWAGKDPKAKPLLLLAHIDVVPVEPGTESKWTHPPFAGEIADGFIWGRGALDDKGSLLALMEAAEALLAQGFTPQRTIYFAFGHDEEIGGDQGAVKIAALLQARGIKAEFSLDEGGAITQGVVAGVERPVASIMAAEKGYASFRLTAHAQGGHSSMPPAASAIGDLALAVMRVQNHRLPGRLIPPVSEMIDRLAPEMPLARRVVLANRWLFGRLVVRMMSATPVGNALVRTTTAPTLLRAGVKDNVLPSEAYAVINFRLLPGDSIANVENHIRLAIADDHIEINREGQFGNEASAVSDTHSAAFDVIARSVNQVFPQALVSTGIVLGATDNRHYTQVFENRYNFSPTLYHPDDLARVHGTNERVGVTAYADMIRFYARLLQNAAGN
jgi:carboxypeptidase PM20D1